MIIDVMRIFRLEVILRSASLQFPATAAADHSFLIGWLAVALVPSVVKFSSNKPFVPGDVCVANAPAHFLLLAPSCTPNIMMPTPALQPWPAAYCFVYPLGPSRCGRRPLVALMHHTKSGADTLTRNISALTY